MNLQTSPAKPAGSRERSLDEVKAEFMRRAGRLNPFEEIRRDDAEQVMSALKSLDKVEWAEAWSKIGLGYEEVAEHSLGVMVVCRGSRSEVSQAYGQLPDSKQDTTRKLSDLSQFLLN